MPSNTIIIKRENNTVKACCRARQVQCIVNLEEEGQWVWKCSGSPAVEVKRDSVWAVPDWSD